MPYTPQVYGMPNGNVNMGMTDSAMSPNLANNMGAMNPSYNVGYVNPAAQAAMMSAPQPSTSVGYVNPNFLKMMNGPSMTPTQTVPMMMTPTTPTNNNQTNFLF